MAERLDWVEIIEPRTKERMYANLITGECVWEPPVGAKIKKTDQNQWWELFDQNTSRFYYYNASSQKTAWHKPHNCDIIPLAKLQTLKQNTEVREAELQQSVRREISTQTPVISSVRITKDDLSHGQNQPGSNRFEHQPHSHRHSGKTGGHSGLSSPSSSGSEARSERGRYQMVPGDFDSLGRGFCDQRSRNSSRQSHQRRESANASQRVPDSPRHQPSADVHRPPHHVPSNDPRPVVDARRFYGSESPFEDLRLSPYLGQDASDQSPLHSPPHLHHHPVFFGHQDSYPYATYDNPANYFGDLTGRFQDASQITNYQPPPVTQRPKPRAFPRTNPAFIGTRRQDGGQSYRRVCQELQQAPSSVAQNQQLLDLHSQQGLALGRAQMMSQSYLSDAIDRRKMFRHERSDSDTSHSSFGIGRLQQDTPEAQVVCQQGARDQYSDSLSSEGSLRGVHVASSGSLRCAAHEKDGFGMKILPYDRFSPCGSFHQHGNDIIGQFGYQQLDEHQLKYNFEKQAQSAHGTPMIRIRARRNSEPDYANLPVIAYLQTEKGARLEDVKRSAVVQLKTEGTSNDELRSGDSLPSGDSLSPTEFCKRRDTPSSVQSGSTQNSEGLPDQGYEDSDNSSLFSSPSPKTHHRHLHASLSLHHSLQERKVDGDGGQTAGKTRITDDADLVQSLSLLLSHSEEDLSVDSASQDATQRQDAIEQFAVENLNEHRKGFLGKAVPIVNMLTWTKDVITKPMIKTNDKAVKKEAPDVFRLVQTYMLDRKAKMPLMQVALEIVTRGWSNNELRDEIYMQLCRQTTDNMREESLMRGWELMGICLSFFPPSVRFYSYLEGYISRHLDLGQDTDKVLVGHFASLCHRRLERISKSGVRSNIRKPTAEKLEQALKSIFRPSMFGNTLEDVMLMQRERFPDRKLPWIQTILSEEVLRLNGAQVEGIFRVPGDIDEVNSLKAQCDQWNVPSASFTEPHTPASLLKLWYRELYDPLIPRDFYDQCVASCSDPEAAVSIVHSLPHINRLVISYLIRFLQVFAAAENASFSKMDASNLAMVMAPNCLRCESEDPNVIFENARKEMAFIRTLIESLDTSFMDNVI